MGLVAREIEGRGIPTCSLTSALSITQTVRPPRAVFVDFPLGHTAGRPDEPDLQEAIVGAALDAFETIRTPGEIVRLPHAWDEGDGGLDAWKRALTGSGRGDDAALDDRSERESTPQYQNQADREAAEQARLAGEGCPGCVWTDSSP